MGKSQDQYKHIFITHRDGKKFTQQGILLRNQILVERLLCFCVLEIKFLEKYRPYSTLKFGIWNIAWNDPQYVVNFNYEFNWYHFFKMTTCAYLFALFVLENYLFYDTRPPSIIFTGVPCYLPIEFGPPVPLLLSLSTPSPTPKFCFFFPMNIQ